MCVCEGVRASECVCENYASNACDVMKTLYKQARPFLAVGNEQNDKWSELIQAAEHKNRQQ